MERFIGQVVACGLSDEELAFAKLAVEVARNQTPKDAEESLVLWDRIVAHGTVARCPMNATSTLLANLTWHEGHTIFLAPERPKRRWRKAMCEPEYTIAVKPW
jgi:hypothetical protein